MAYLRQLGVLGLLGACYFVVVGCDDDGDKIPSGGEGGEGGEAAGKGGKATGGSNNNPGGKAGMGGGGGKAGNGGNAGTNADAGRDSGGEGGTGNVVGGAGGEETGGGGGAGGGGAAGEGGMSTAGAGGEGRAPVAVVTMCQYECEIPADCERDVAADWTCNPFSHVCQDPIRVSCDADADCLPVFSPWGAQCADGSTCSEGEECVAWQGKGYCAPLEDLDLGGCFFSVPMTLPKKDGLGDAVVCASADPRCFDNVCDKPGCLDEFASCGDGDGHCSETTGHCECSDASECATGICGADGRCGTCENDGDCDSAGLDKCIGGHCGCAGVNSCPNVPYMGAVKACE